MKIFLMRICITHYKTIFLSYVRDDAIQAHTLKSAIVQLQLIYYLITAQITMH